MTSTYSPLDTHASPSARTESDLEVKTPATSGPTFTGLFARFDLVSCSWRTLRATGQKDSVTFSETWPKSGMTQSGLAYALPTSAPPITVNGSSYLPTPKANDWRDNNSPAELARNDPNLTAVTAYFPTPSASDGSGSGVDPDGRRAGNHSVQSIDAVLDANFGKYQPAIDRWACVLSVPAPAPTTPNKNGNPQLSILFDEWLMGIPGRISIVPGLARKHQLKIIGNGVVPQQAEAAYDHLLEGIQI